MVEVKNGKKILTTPISAEDLEGIHVGDIVYLNGSMTEGCCHTIISASLKFPGLQCSPASYSES